MEQKPKPAATDSVHNAFVGTLSRLHRGLTLTELTLAEQDLVQAVRQTGKAGVLTLKVRIAPSSKGDDMMMLTADVIVTKPKPAKSPTIMYATDDDRLSQTDPRQLEHRGLIPLESVDQPQPQPIAARPAAKAS